MTIRNIFAQQLMETIAGAVTLKNRQHWNPDQYEKISESNIGFSISLSYNLK